jgi:hypothetical protein
MARLAQPDCQARGWLLDGFPHTACQAQALAAAGVVPDKVALLSASHEVLLDRVQYRWAPGAAAVQVQYMLYRYMLYMCSTGGRPGLPLLAEAAAAAATWVLPRSHSGHLWSPMAGYPCALCCLSTQLCQHVASKAILSHSTCRHLLPCNTTCTKHSDSTQHASPCNTPLPLCRRPQAHRLPDPQGVPHG